MRRLLLQRAEWIVAAVAVAAFWAAGRLGWSLATGATVLVCILVAYIVLLQPRLNRRRAGQR